ncbi:MAG: helix-turn-helix domain-containing protein [Alicyclobacillus sp.]|nr:helix-turn-helix domain-containing protein [Alicyclobacillus sp.]
MLMNLLGGRALPASELARAARVTPQTASSHLAKMVEGGLLVHEAYGRHRYYRLASEEVGQALEALNAIALPKPVRSLRESDQSKALHFARTCYDHLAGEVGVALTDRMLELGLIRAEGRDYVVTTDGAKWFPDFGIDLDGIRRGRRHFARECLDWSERRHHLAGALGAALTNRLFDLGWIERVPGGRAVRVTRTGFARLESDLGATFEESRKGAKISESPSV